MFNPEQVVLPLLLERLHVAVLVTAEDHRLVRVVVIRTKILAVLPVTRILIIVAVLLPVSLQAVARGLHHPAVIPVVVVLVAQVVAEALAVQVVVEDNSISGMLLI